jgi:hypothetical protein
VLLDDTTKTTATNVNVVELEGGKVVERVGGENADKEIVAPMAEAKTWLIFASLEDQVLDVSKSSDHIRQVRASRFVVTIMATFRVLHHVQFPVHYHEFVPCLRLTFMYRSRERDGFDEAR